jgi:hypothetical protein
MVNIIRKAWQASAPLTFTALLMLAAFVVSSAGIFLDSRIITGTPAWLKPAKFAISTTLYCGTLAWLYRWLDIWPRFLRAMAWVTSFVIVAEVVLIDMQAARGTTSHFNASTPLDATLYAVMGTMIAVLWLASIGILAAAIRQKFENPAWGWSLRLGLLIAVIGAGMGGLMTRPTPDQLAEIRQHQTVRVVGAHTVGAADGGPGIPGVGWSTGHGDVRIPHFFGLHALQIIPLLGWLISRRQGRNSVKLVFAAAGSYLGLVAILAWQALRGQSILDPDGATLLAFTIWLVATVVTMVAFRRPKIGALTPRYAFFV